MASEPTAPATGRSRWDLLIVALGVAGGMWSRHPASEGDMGYFTKYPAGAPSSLTALLLAEGFIFGFVCSGPAVVAVQWARGRRSPLRTGELMWLGAAALRLAAFVLAVLFDRDIAAAMLLWFVGQGLLSLLALAVLLSELSEPKRPAVWTEPVGYVACVLAAAAPVIIVIVEVAAIGIGL